MGVHLEPVKEIRKFGRRQPKYFVDSLGLVIELGQQGTKLQRKFYKINSLFMVAEIIIHSVKI